MFATSTFENTVVCADEDRGRRSDRTPSRPLMSRWRPPVSSAVSCGACGLTVSGRPCACGRGTYLPTSCPECGSGLRGSRGCSDCGAPAPS